MTQVRRDLIALLQRTKAKYVAARLGIHPSAVSQWASGRTEPTTDHLAALRRNYPGAFPAQMIARERHPWG